MDENLIQRDIENKILKWIPDREIIAIRGPRQSGKTTMLELIKKKLISKGIELNHIHYFSFEDINLRLKFQENPKKFIEFYLSENKKNYFLLDEVQYIADCGQKLKLIFDSFEDIKIMITGSSSFDLTQLGKFLVGRVIFFNLYPFNFNEFLRANGKRYEKLYDNIRIDLEKFNHKKVQKTPFLDELNELLHEYLRFGSYPRVVLEKNREKKKELLKNIFITYIEKDIVGLYGIKYRDNVVKLLKSISSMLGGVVKYETLAESSGLKYHQIRELMPLLEDSFVISLVKPFHKNLLNELRKNPKIYFVDYGLRNYLIENFDRIKFDNLYENFVYNELRENFNIKYWRTTAKTEVDFVLEKKNNIFPIEVKTKPKIRKSFRSFISHYKPKKAFILNLNSIDKKNINGCEVNVFPLSYL